MTPSSLLDFPTVEAYLKRVNAKPRSLLSAVITQQHEDGSNYFYDVAVIKFTRQGDVEIRPEGFSPPTEQESNAIKVEMSSANWPEHVAFDDDDKDIPEEAKDAYWFRDINGKCLMGQVRGVGKDGKKFYRPISKWSDGKFRWAEPEGLLPLYGIEQLKNYTTVILHEGPKAAKRCQLIASGQEPGHPWETELSNAAHLGWAGGALAVDRTDWTILERHGVQRVYIVADNDELGLAAITKIAHKINCVTMSIEFSDQFPKSFDLGDDFPSKMFKKIEDKKFYVGPSFRECMNMATYMTKLIPHPDPAKAMKGAVVPVMRQHAKGLWAYIDELELFVNTEFPDIVMKKEALDAMLTPFSDSRRTTELIIQNYKGRTSRLTYRPDIKGRRVITNGETAINTYIPSSIKPSEGDPKPFLDFMEYLIPNKDECYDVLRWVATLVARPDVRILYGLLLISEQTGTGKTTLAERICAPLVGDHNTSYPSENQITASDFNDWCGRKRLAVCNEIYQGTNFKAANRLKSIITDRFVEVNQKFMPVIRLENFISVIACSNSLKALKIDSTDRRWMIPYITEERWPREKFNDFLNWLDSGGLQIICNWCHTFPDHIQPGEIAPDSKRKQEMIEDGMSEAQTALAMLAKAMNRHSDPVAVGFRDAKHWLPTVGVQKIFDSDQELQRAIKEQGIAFSEARISIGGFEQRLGMNKLLVDKLKSIDDKKERVKLAKSYIKKPNDIMDGVM